jgi:hypothetical protein
MAATKSASCAGGITQQALKCGLSSFFLALHGWYWPIAIAGSAIASILIIVGVQYGLRSPDPQRTPDVTSSLPPSPQISPSVSPQLQKTPSPSSTRTVPSTPPSSTPRPIASPSSSPSPAQPNPDLGSDGSLSHATIIEILDGDQVYINDTKVRVHAIARAGQTIRTGLTRASIGFPALGAVRLGQRSSLIVGSSCIRVFKGRAMISGIVDRNGCLGHIEVLRE